MQQRTASGAYPTCSMALQLMLVLPCCVQHTAASGRMYTLPRFRAPFQSIIHERPVADPKIQMPQAGQAEEQGSLHSSVA